MGEIGGRRGQAEIARRLGDVGERAKRGNRQLVVLYLVVGMLPSVLAELELFGQEGQPLGRWLSGTFRRLDRVLAVLVSLSVACAGVVTIDLVFSRLGLDPWPGLRQLTLAVQHSSQDALGPLTLVLAAASATAALTLLGGLLSRYLPGLRAPLDIALDVDSHFREFPRKGIPRSRIFSSSLTTDSNIGRTRSSTKRTARSPLRSSKLSMATSDACSA